MTCFWDGIISSLDSGDFSYVGIPPPQQQQITKIKFIKLLKKKNRKANTKWQKMDLSRKEKNEHFSAISSYDINNISNGHLTGVCDSFLLLICDMFGVNIEHCFLNTKIIYENPIGCRKTLKFISDNGHFRKI